MSFLAIVLIVVAAIVLVLFIGGVVASGRRRSHDAAHLRETLALLQETVQGFDNEHFLRAEQTPVFFGSALNNFGVEPFLDYGSTTGSGALPGWNRIINNRLPSGDGAGEPYLLIPSA